MSTRKLTKLPDELKEPLKLLAAPQSCNSIPIEETKKKLPEIDKGSQVKSISQIARRSDMDMNGHVSPRHIMSCPVMSVSNHTRIQTDTSLLFTLVDQQRSLHSLGPRISP